MGFRFGATGITDDDHVSRQIAVPGALTVLLWFRQVAGVDLAPSTATVFPLSFLTTDGLIERGGLWFYRAATNDLNLAFELHNGTNMGSWSIPIQGSISYDGGGANAGPLSTRWHSVVVTYSAASTGNVPTFYIDGKLWPGALTVWSAPTGTRAAGTTIDFLMRVGNRKTASSECCPVYIGPSALWSGLLGSRECIALGKGFNPMSVRPDVRLACFQMNGSLISRDGRGVTTGGAPSAVTNHPPIRGRASQMNFGG